MRHLALALVLLLAACAADPVIAPRDCTPGTTTSCACPGASGVQTCTAAGTVGACVCPDAGGGDAVAVADAPAVDVVSPENRPAPVDVVAVADAGTDAVDAPVVDVDPRQTPECRAVNQTCDGRRVNVQTGERDGGVTYHCGRCGNTCAAGFGCLTCVCIPL